jgi:hypothetical protein
MALRLARHLASFAGWLPPHPGHFIVAWGHTRPITPHVATSHRCPAVKWPPEQIAHTSSTLWHWNSEWPHAEHLPHSVSALFGVKYWALNLCPATHISSVSFCTAALPGTLKTTDAAPAGSLPRWCCSSMVLLFLIHLIDLGGIKAP